MSTYMASYDHDMNYLSHHGVQGMKWGRRKQRPSSGRSRKQTTLQTYKKDNSPKRFKVMNAANSAARSHYRTERTKSFTSYRKASAKRDIKEARLTESQIKNGRYRVARARSIKRNVASVALGTAAGAAAVASGAAIVAPVLAAVGTTSMHFVSGAHYYGKQRKAYGGTRAKYQNQSQKKAA